MADALLIETGWPAPPLSPNARPNRYTKAAAVKKARAEAYWLTYQVAPVHWANGNERFKVTIRAHPAVGRKRDEDNLIASLKPHLDGIATALGVNDSGFELQPIQWGQRKPGGRVVFEIERAA